MQDAETLIKQYQEVRRRSLLNDEDYILIKRRNMLFLLRDLLDSVIRNEESQSSEHHFLDNLESKYNSWQRPRGDITNARAASGSGGAAFMFLVGLGFLEDIPYKTRMFPTSTNSIESRIEWISKPKEDQDVAQFNARIFLYVDSERKYYEILFKFRFSREQVLEEMKILER